MKRLFILLNAAGFAVLKSSYGNRNLNGAPQEKIIKSYAADFNHVFIYAKDQTPKRCGSFHIFQYT